MERFYPGIKGNLEVVASEEEDKEFGEKWQEVVISGDPEGLRSLAELLIALADLIWLSVVKLNKRTLSAFARGYAL